MPLIKCSKILSPHTSINSFFKKTKDGKSFGIEVAASPFPQHKLSKLCMRPEAWACTQDYWSVVKKARDYKQSRCPADVWRSAVILFQTRGTLLCSCLTQFPRKVASSSDSTGSRYPSEYLRHIQWSQWLVGFLPNYSRIKEDGSDQHRHPLFFASELFMPLFKTFYCSLQNSLRMKGVNKKGSQRWTLTMRPGGFANSGYSQRWGPRIVLECGCKHTLPKPHPLRLPQRHMSQIPSPLFSTPLQLADRLCSCNFKATP